MVTSILMLLKENKTNFTFAIWIFQSSNYTTKFVCSLSVLLLFNLQSTLTKHNTVSNAPEQAEEMHKGQQKVIISPWNHFFFFVGIIFL